MPGVADAWGLGGSGGRWGRWAREHERCVGPRVVEPGLLAAARGPAEGREVEGWAGRSVARVGPACARCWAVRLAPPFSPFLFFFSFFHFCFMLHTCVYKSSSMLHPWYMFGILVPC